MVGTGKERGRCDKTGGGKEGPGISPHPARKLGLDGVGCSGGPAPLEGPRGAEIGGSLVGRLDLRILQCPSRTLSPARLRAVGSSAPDNVPSPPGDSGPAVSSAEVRGCRGRVCAGQPGSGGRTCRCVRGLAWTRGARRTGSRHPLILSNFQEQRPAAAPASPVPQRHLAGSAGGAYPLRLRIGLRGSAHLRNNPWVGPLPFRRPPNRFCSHLVWGNKLLVGFRSCRLQCPICPGVYELPKPPCVTLPHPRAVGAKPGFLSGA